MGKRIVLLFLICTAIVLEARSQKTGAVSQSDSDKVLALREQVLSNCDYKSEEIQNGLNAILDLYKQAYTTESCQFADCLMWCAMICEENGDNKQALSLLNSSCNIFKLYGTGPFEGRDTLHEIFRLDLRSKIEYNSERDLVAIHRAQDACQLKKVYFGERSENYLKSLLEISKLYAERLNYTKSQYYHNLGYKTYVEVIRREFCELSESERSLYWTSVKDYIGKTIDIAYLSARALSGKNKDAISSAAYNALLLSKGLLLNTTVGFEDYVLKSGNEKAANLLSYKKSLAAQGVSLSTLDSIDYAILRALDENGQKFDIPHLHIGWEDVARQLDADDLAIEFFKNSTGGFGALLVKRDWTAPKIVRLDYTVTFRGKRMSLGKAMQLEPFKSFTQDDANDLWRLGKAIWSDDIVKHFPKTEKGRVFFSADAEMLVTGIEYLPFVKPRCEGETIAGYYCLADLFNVFRLSSTRELVTHAQTTGSQAAIYGGLLYNMSMRQLASDMNNYPELNTHEIYYALNEQQRGSRGALEAIPYLRGTKTEADSILCAINKPNPRNLSAVPYIGNKGTEASFKALSGRNINLIHVGTHGFFYNADDTVSIKRFKLDDNPLSHSGLLFAGADNKWFGDVVPKGVEDGFLTALEISLLDFRGLDLVTLSACETGKGEIHSDGVFGLQRGFKMAGANSILMSLWKVDDNATCMLMTEFYKNWISNGMTKHDALEAAKRTVRSHTEKGWDDPKYWAAFILLDALD